ncbi:hypothetical protein QBC33DRAFT_553314 [Phialemonium atrogriseum]|uniref:Ubiquitin-like protease family profile domain-containing protein n=1 Tax=Phialemonium atrogriseum TaxID=1093897 RepID=A0AAJ0FH63_9PEZI|nr:uncharacterized protein QBC33DRAFT_553314 [Phialemonium atrogriseum]KAK1761819.1 hypothetical protein QBC33DRAFT_553314 [Phialemonium atrogriseum]
MRSRARLSSRGRGGRPVAGERSASVPESVNIAGTGTPQIPDLPGLANRGQKERKLALALWKITEPAGVAAFDAFLGPCSNHVYTDLHAMAKHLPFDRVKSLLTQARDERLQTSASSSTPKKPAGAGTPKFTMPDAKKAKELSRLFGSRGDADEGSETLRSPSEEHQQQEAGAETSTSPPKTPTVPLNPAQADDAPMPAVAATKKTPAPVEKNNTGDKNTQREENKDDEDEEIEEEIRVMGENESPRRNRPAGVFDRRHLTPLQLAHGTLNSVLSLRPPRSIGRRASFHVPDCPRTPFEVGLDDWPDSIPRANTEAHDVAKDVNTASPAAPTLLVSSTNTVAGPGKPPCDGDGDGAENKNNTPNDDVDLLVPVYDKPPIPDKPQDDIGGDAAPANPAKRRDHHSEGGEVEGVDRPNKKARVEPHTTEEVESAHSRSTVIDVEATTTAKVAGNEGSPAPSPSPSAGHEHGRLSCSGGVLPRSRLTDAPINAVLHLLAAARPLSLATIDSVLTDDETKIPNGLNPSSRPTRKMLVMGKNEQGKLLIPLHIAKLEHWVLMVITAGPGLSSSSPPLAIPTVQLFDSYPSPGTDPVAVRLTRSIVEALCAGGIGVGNTRGWTKPLGRLLPWNDSCVTSAPSCLRQSNDADCGVAVLVNAMYNVAGLNPPESLTKLSWDLWRWVIAMMATDFRRKQYPDAGSNEDKDEEFKADCIRCLSGFNPEASALLDQAPRSQGNSGDLGADEANDLLSRLTIMNTVAGAFDLSAPPPAPPSGKWTFAVNREYNKMLEEYIAHRRDAEASARAQAKIKLRELGDSLAAISSVLELLCRPRIAASAISQIKGDDDVVMDEQNPTQPMDDLEAETSTLDLLRDFHGQLSTSPVPLTDLLAKTESEMQMLESIVCAGARAKGLMSLVVSIVARAVEDVGEMHKIVVPDEEDS